MDTNKLQHMLRAEIAADDWWADMSDAEKKAYIAAHPGSKYAKGAKRSDTKEETYHKTAAFHKGKADAYMKK